MGDVANELLSKTPKDIAIPSIVLFELEVGIAKSNNSEKRRAQLATLVSRIHITPFGEEEARHAAILRADLERIGAPIGCYDTLIAGTALSHNATLITHNTKEFQRVSGLNIEDWY